MRTVAWLVAFGSLQAGLVTGFASPNRPSVGPSPSSPGVNTGARSTAGDVRTTVQTVRIDVIARDARGRIIENLTSSDFELSDDGMPQRLEEVRYVPRGRDNERVVAIFLDEYHVSSTETDRVREALASFIDREIQPNDLLVVMKPLDSIFAIHLTTDRDAARAVVQAFEGCKGDYAARSAYERNFMAGAPARVESARTQVTLSALNALAVGLAAFPDRRKALMVITEGFSRVERRRGLEYLSTVESIVRSADQANVAIYPISPGRYPSAQNPRAGDPGSRIGPSPSSSGGPTDVGRAPSGDVLEPIETLAAETAGHAAGPDVSAGLRDALDDLSGYYLLTYRITRPEDGEFHSVQVRIKPPGAEVRARKGYFATSPDEALRAAILAKANEPKIDKPPEPAPHASALIRPWFGMARGADGKTRVTFVWEPAARLTGERNRRTPSRLLLKALAQDDSVVFDGVVMPTGATVQESGVPAARAVFDTPPGRLRLRMSIQDAAQRVLDSDVRSISVRDMKADVAIGTPEVLRARNAREFRELETEAAVPVASREFSRAERLLIRFRVYGPSSAHPTVTATLRSRIGGVMRELTVTPSTALGDISEIDVPLAGLAAGEYLVELSATSPAGRVTDVVDFRVEP